jgi:uncharacterized protein (TIGR02246 family)
MNGACEQDILSSKVEAATECAISALLDTLVISWNSGDGQAYGAAFDESCDYVTFNGDRLRGRAAVANSHQTLFDTHLQGSTLFFETTEMRAIAPDIVLIHGIGNSLLKGQTQPSPSRRSIQTFVAVDTVDGWRFTAFHNTRIFKINALRALLMMFGIV